MMVFMFFFLENFNCLQLIARCVVMQSRRHQYCDNLMCTSVNFLSVRREEKRRRVLLIMETKSNGIYLFCVWDSFYQNQCTVCCVYSVLYTELLLVLVQCTLTLISNRGEKKMNESFSVFFSRSCQWHFVVVGVFFPPSVWSLLIN